MGGSLGGKNFKSSRAQVAFGPFKGGGVIRSDQHAGQAVAALIERAAIPVLGEFCQDWSSTGDVFECANLQVTSQRCRFGLRGIGLCGIDLCGLRSHQRCLWARDDRLATTRLNWDA